MKRMCRDRSSSWRNREEVSTVLRHARIVTDPRKLAELHAAAARQKSGAGGLRKRYNIAKPVSWGIF